MKKNGRFLCLGVIFFCIFSMAGCKSSPKRGNVTADYMVDDTYNPDDYYYDDGGYSGLADQNYYNAPPPAVGGISGDPFSIVKSRVWQLVEIRIGYGIVALDRQQMAYNNLNDVYIIQFTDEGVSGKAAPNRYFAPYERREGKNITIRQIVGTLMAGNINVGGLMENEYYWYLQRITRMDVVNGYLELYATPNTNEEIVLRYRAE